MIVVTALAIIQLQREIPAVSCMGAATFLWINTKLVSESIVTMKVFRNLQFYESQFKWRKKKILPYRDPEILAHQIVISCVLKHD